MRSPDTERIDRLVVDLYFRDFPLASGDEVIEEILEIVERHAAELMPTKVTAGKRTARYSRAAARRQFAQRESRPPWTLWLVKDDKPELLLTLDFSPEWHAPFRVSWQVLPFDFYREEPFARERAQRLISFVQDMTRRFQPWYGFGHSHTDASMGADDTPRHGFLPLIASEVYWLNVYGREMVDAMGRERVLSTPVAHMDQLPQGGVLFLTRSTPADFNSEEARKAQAKALVHLRPEMPFEAVLNRLLERSAALAPVEKHWDPDLVELLEHVLDHTVKLKDRQRATARFNAYRPPPVTEWMPLEQAPPSDVDELDSMLLHYHAMAIRSAKDARENSALLMEQSPRALIAFDCNSFTYGLHAYEDRANVETTLIPLAGAYLGELMVKHLGGHWVPRKASKEAYIALGGRAWLPFLRARHCLRDRQSVVDYSLTKFYREAERYIRSWSSNR